MKGMVTMHMSVKSGRLCKHPRRPVLWSMFAVFLSAIIGGCNPQQAQGPPGMNPEVAVVSIETRAVPITTELVGRVAAFRVADVRPQITGIVQKRMFTEGTDVKAGQILYQIDPAPFRAALDNARAALARSESQLAAIRPRAERLRELVAENAVSKQDYDDAAAALKQAEADVKYWQAMVEAAQINLNYTSINAPISGRIGKSSVTEGALVTAQQPVSLAVIQQLDPVYVDVPQSSKDILRLRRAMTELRKQPGKNTVRLILEDGTAYDRTGKLQFRDVTVDQTTGSVILRVVISNPRGVLLPGMFVRAIVEEGVHPRAVLIPQQAVSRDPRGNPYTLIVNPNNVVEVRPLVLDRAFGDQWLVSSGLAAGDRVIVEGIQRVRPGVTVRVVNFSAPEKKAAGETGTAKIPGTGVK